MGEGAYPRFDDEKKKWLVALIEGMVSRPNDARIIRYYGGLDLQVSIIVAPQDEHIFTAEVCEAIETIVAAATGVLSPVIYLEGKPHPDAKESLDYAANQI